VRRIPVGRPLRIVRPLAPSVKPVPLMVLRPTEHGNYIAAFRHLVAPHHLVCRRPLGADQCHLVSCIRRRAQRVEFDKLVGNRLVAEADGKQHCHRGGRPDRGRQWAPRPTAGARVWLLAPSMGLLSLFFSRPGSAFDEYSEKDQLIPDRSVDRRAGAHV